MKLEGTSGDHPVPELGQLQQVVQYNAPSDFEYLQGWTLNSFSGQPVPVLSHPRGKEVFPHVQTEPPMFRFVPTASGLVTGHH